MWPTTTRVGNTFPGGLAGIWPGTKWRVPGSENRWKSWGGGEGERWRGVETGEGEVEAEGV